MKKHQLSLFFFAMFFLLGFKTNENVVEVRNLFYRAAKSEAAADSLFAQMQQISELDGPAMMGYKSMSHFMVCYHSINPYTKYKYFLSGKGLMEDAVKKYPDDIELRFLRLTIQLNVPSFLGYSNDITSDKKMILSNAGNIKDEDLFKRIYEYTYTAKKLSTDEKKTLQEALNKNQLSKKFR